MKTYTVGLRVMDNETQEVLLDVEIPNAKREDLFEPEMDTPGIDAAAKAMLTWSAF